MIVGHGIDIVKIADTAQKLKSLGKVFTDPLFTAQELSSSAGGEEEAAKLSGRLAVKEAVLKALGTGFGAGVAFVDVEVINDVNGRPTIVLHRRLQKIAEELGIERWLVTTSHEAGIAVASVIALGRK